VAVADDPDATRAMPALDQDWEGEEPEPTAPADPAA